MLDRSEQLQALFLQYANPQTTLIFTGENCNLTQSTQDYEADKIHLETGLKKDSELISRYSGKRPTGNESQDDLGFMNKLALWCNCNQSLMQEAFLNSPYFAQKDEEHKKKILNRKDYFERTIQKAIEGTFTVEGANGKGEPQAKTLLTLIENSGASFFRSDTNDLYAAIPINGHIEIWPLDGRDFSIWLQGLYYDKMGRPVNGEPLKQTISVLAARAIFDCPKPIALHIRVAGSKDAIWYDLTNSDWQAIKVTAQGWELIDNTPILFRRYRHQATQVTPAQNGDVHKILKYVNLKGQKTLFLCWLINCFVPAIPHAMLVFYGEKGAAKTTTCTLTKAVIDPSTLDTLTLQNKFLDLVVSLQQHWYLPFDNVSYISKETSDTLCRAITGSGIQQRKLYTNDDDIVFTFMRCLAINGISNVATRSDLLDRSILMELERISEDERQELAKIQAEFEVDRAKILGGILDILSKAMVIFPTVKLKNLPRMADFTCWGYAIGEALGGLGNEFLEQYARNRQSQNDEVIANDHVATLMVEFMRNQKTWNGSISALLSELHKIGYKHGINTNSKAFPVDPTRLSKRLRSIESNLEIVGIKCDFQRRSDARCVVITKNSVISVNSDKA